MIARSAARLRSEATPPFADRGDDVGDDDLGDRRGGERAQHHGAIVGARPLVDDDAVRRGGRERLGEPLGGDDETCTDPGRFGTQRGGDELAHDHHDHELERRSRPGRGRR